MVQTHPPLHRALRKYGKESFELDVLEECPSIVELNAAETRWIKKLGTFGKGGYNCTTGGEGFVMAEATKKRIAASRIGMKLSEEHRKRISEATRGENNPFYGKKHKASSMRRMKRKLSEMFSNGGAPFYGRRHTPEAKKRMSEAHKGTSMHPNTRAGIAKANKGNQYTKGRKITVEHKEKYARLTAEDVRQIKSNPEGHTQRPHWAYMEGRKYMKSLVLSGGSSKGAYQVGVLKKWMGEDGRDYEIICGVSVGALNGSYLSQFKYGEPKAASDGLLGLWSRVKNENVKKSWCLGALASLWKRSVYDSTPLQKWIDSELNLDLLAKSGKLLRVGCTSWRTGQYTFATEKDPNIKRWVMASSSYPVFMLPIEIGDDLWTDGGLRSVTPLGEAIRLGAEEIDVIMCSRPDLPSDWDWHKEAAIPGFLMQSMSIMSDEIMMADLQVCGLKNDLAELTDRYRKVKIRLLRPSAPLGVEPMDFGQENIQRLIQIGYEDAQKSEI